MKTYLAAVAALVIFSIPTLGTAAAARPGPYFSAFLGTSLAKDATVSSFDFSAKKAYNDQVSFDPGIYLGGTGGYDFGFIRLEGEFSYRHANIDSITDTTGYNFRNVDGNIGTFATMFNVFLDMHNGTIVTPYVGGGIGFATLFMSDTTAYDTRDLSHVVVYDEGDDTVFAAQVGAGIDIAFSDRKSLDIGYRYFRTDKANFDTYFDFISDTRLESHNVMVGFKFKY